MNPPVHASDQEIQAQIETLVQEQQLRKRNSEQATPPRSSPKRRLMGDTPPAMTSGNEAHPPVSPPQRKLEPAGGSGMEVEP